MVQPWRCFKGCSLFLTKILNKVKSSNFSLFWTPKYFLVAGVSFLIYLYFSCGIHVSLLSFLISPHSYLKTFFSKTGWLKEFRENIPWMQSSKSLFQPYLLHSCFLLLWLCHPNNPRIWKWARLWQRLMIPWEKFKLSSLKQLSLSISLSFPFSLSLVFFFFFDSSFKPCSCWKTMVWVGFGG